VQCHAGAADGDGEFQLPKHISREATTLARMQHSNIVGYYGAWMEIDDEDQNTGQDPLECHFDPFTRQMSAISTAFVEMDSTRGLGYYTSSVASELEDDSVLFLDASEGGPSSSPTENVTDADYLDAASHGRAASKSPTAPEGPRAVLFIHTELCTAGTLASWLSRRNAALAAEETTTEERKMWADKAFEIFEQCTAALAHMHAHGIAHRDVKPANILFGEDGQARLADFGLARFVVDNAEEAAPGAEVNDVSQHTQAVGTPVYASPEQLAGGSYGTPSDIHALGVVLAELLFPVGTQMERAIFLEGLRCGRCLPKETIVGPAEASRLVLAMTHPDPCMRPSATDILDALAEHASAAKVVDSKSMLLKPLEDPLEQTTYDPLPPKAIASKPRLSDGSCRRSPVGVTRRRLGAGGLHRRMSDGACRQGQRDRTQPMPQQTRHGRHGTPWPVQVV
jgi:serine/threonine protein kinase